MRETEHGIQSALEYSTSLFEPSTIERMALHLRCLLEAIVTSPEEKFPSSVDGWR